MSDHPRYPRYDVWKFLDPHDDEGQCVAHRVSSKRAADWAARSAASRGDDFWPVEARKLTANRFRVKINHGARNPFILKDATRPAYLGQYPTLDRAMMAMDNTIRAERGMPARIDWHAVGMYSQNLDNRAPALEEAIAQATAWRPEGFTDLDAFDGGAGS